MAINQPELPDWETLRQVYEERARGYIYTGVAANRRLSRKHAGMLQWIRSIPGGTVLDAGCGDGVYTAPLSSRPSAFVVGVDISHKILLEASKRLDNEGDRTSARFVGSNLEILPFRNDAFDGVVCAQAIEHLLSEAQGLRELYRVMKPKAIMVIATDNRDNYVSRFLGLPFAAVKLAMRSLLRFRGRSLRFPHKSYTLGQFKKMLEDAGFSVEETESFRFTCPGPLANSRLLTAVLDRVESVCIRSRLIKGWGDIIVAVCRKS